MGVYQAVYGVGMFIGPVAAGWIISALPTAAEGMAANFYANGALLAAGRGADAAAFAARGLRVFTSGQFSLFVITNPLIHIPALYAASKSVVRWSEQCNLRAFARVQEL